MLVKPSVSFAGRLKFQKTVIRHSDYTHLALLTAISLDDEADQRVSLDELKARGRVIDLGAQRVPIALSLDHQDLLLPAGLPRILPDIPDPSAPPRLSVTDPATPFIKQLWRDRASGETVIDKVYYLVFQPVRKIVLLNDGSGMFPTGASNSAWPRILCNADGEGRHMVLLFDALSGHAFFLGGRFQFSVALRRSSPESARAAVAP